MRSAALPLVLATACSASGLSILHATTVRSSHPAGTTIALGEPVTIDISWTCEGECTAVPITVTCDGMPCGVERDGDTLRVSPAAPGSTLITLLFEDQLFGGSKRATFGPYTVVPVDRDELHCTVRAPGTVGWRPCSDGVVAGDDVRVEGWTSGGGRRVSDVDASVVVNDGFLNGGWMCSRTSLATAAGGVAPACMAYGIYAGTYRIVLDRRGTRAELSLTVAEAHADGASTTLSKI